MLTRQSFFILFTDIEFQDGKGARVSARGEGRLGSGRRCGAVRCGRFGEGIGEASCNNWIAQSSYQKKGYYFGHIEKKYLCAHFNLSIRSIDYSIGKKRSISANIAKRTKLQRKAKETIAQSSVTKQRKRHSKEHTEKGSVKKHHKRYSKETGIAIRYRYIKTQYCKKTKQAIQ